MRHIFAPIRPALLCAFLALAPAALAGPGAEPVPPLLSEGIARLEFGVFCAWQQMDRAPAPGTETGWIHVPLDQIDFTWAGQQVVPAVIGMGFGIKATGAPGFATAVGETRVFRPGRAEPEAWASDISEIGPTLAFFRFDRPEELIPGTWAIEGWDRGNRLYRVEFEVVPATALPGLAGACEATS